MQGASFLLGSTTRIVENLSVPALYEAALLGREARLANDGALVVETAPHTGRSPQDKYLVRDERTETEIWWDNTASLSPHQFSLLKDDFLRHARGKSLFAQDLIAGADRTSQFRVRVTCELAWHALFIRNLLRPAPAVEVPPDLTIVDLPSFRAEPARHGTRSDTVIAIDLTQGLVLIGGTRYGGEIKKAVFTVLNYLLPQRGILPMHCSANLTAGGESAVFFGLSGTGKTTLSADPDRILIGDDEHGWGPNGIFNFEHGCYAKVIRLNADAEPAISAAARRFGTILENVVIHPSSGEIEFDDASLAENSRAAFPIDFIANANRDGLAPHPRAIIMLAADAFGVLPPLARLTPAQAIYHFLSGYTAKVAGTERGILEPQATFSSCFGAPFLPRQPRVYGNLLKDLIERHGTSCWLVNTGWTHGPFGRGQRISISVTRRLLAAALSGELRSCAMRTDPHFGFSVPLFVDGVDARLLDPRQAWADPMAYDRQAKMLVAKFIQNFAKFEADVPGEIRAASPGYQVAAE